MLTRGDVTHQYQHAPGGTPPLHVHGFGHTPGSGYAGPSADRGRLYGAGGLMGGAVTLGARGPVGSKLGNTGYGWLGMDPSDPLTWPRPFNPQPGMIAWLNWQSR